MNIKCIGLAACLTFLLSCNSPVSEKIVQSNTPWPLKGTWKLLSGTTIENKDTTVTDFTKGKSFIKIINDTHFAFLQHDLSQGKDSSAASFSAGGGRYTLTDSMYTEYLDYCSDRQWEGHSFEFSVKINGDTLIQQGVEKIANIGVDRINIEKYIREK